MVPLPLGGAPRDVYCRLCYCFLLQLVLQFFCLLQFVFLLLYVLLMLMFIAPFVAAWHGIRRVGGSSGGR